MRTNIDIDDSLMESAMRAGPFSSKREAVEAGLQLLARKAAYRDILALRGQLQWDDGSPTSAATVLTAHSPLPPPDIRQSPEPERAATVAAKKSQRK